MSDLISRSALIKALEEDKKSICSHVYGCINPCDADDLEFELEWVIYNQPTAYNVDSVVAEMEEIRKVFAEGKQLYGYCIKHGDCGDTNCFDCVLTNAIEIVRKGGV